MLRVYLAARYSRRMELCVYREQLRTLGFEVTSRWLNGTHQYGADAARAEADLGTDADMADRFATEDVEDLTRSDLVVSFTEPPRQPSTNRGGRHVEFGMAYAQGKRLLVVGHRENAFHYLSGVEFYPTWDEALGELMTTASLDRLAALA